MGVTAVATANEQDAETTAVDVSILLRLPTATSPAAVPSPMQLLPDPDAPWNVLVVTVGTAPNDWVDTVQASSASIGEIAVVTDAPTTRPDGVTQFERLSSPDDPTALGVRINERLRGWSDAPVVVVFDSLTALLGVVEYDIAIKFLSVLLDGVRAADGVAHVCMDPDAHDEDTVATVAALLGGTAAVDEDGWTYADA
jgi:hypothetical protein